MADENHEMLFSWQQADYERLTDFLKGEQRILLLHGRDFDSPYHVVSAISSDALREGQALFRVYADPICRPNSFLPFSLAIMQAIKTEKRNHSILPSIVKDFTKSETLASVVKNLSQEPHHSVALDQRENDLLIQFEYAANEYAPLFVFCRYPAFDARSKNLSLLLLSGRLDDDYPFLTRAKYIFLCDVGDSDSFPAEIENIEHIDIYLSEPQLGNVKEIVAEIDSQLSLQESEEEKLFYLAGGRLSCMEILLRHLSEKNQKAMNAIATDAIEATMKEHLTQLGSSGVEIADLLSVAASIGNNFSIPLLKKAFDNPSCDKILQRSDKEFFTVCNTDTGHFALHEIWDYFYAHLDHAKRTEISSKLAEAIYYFDPYDFYSRGYYYEQSTQYLEACEQYILAFNKTYFDGVAKEEKELANKIFVTSKQCGIVDYWNNLLRVYSSMEQLDYEACIASIEAMPHPPTQRLFILKEYLEGLCLHRLGRTHEQQVSAIITIQSAANHAKDLEDGIWCDCQTMLLSLHININGNLVAARQIMKELSYFCTQKSIAPFAQCTLHVLERKWAALYSVERAVVKTENSVRYFRNEQYPAQYLMALNNHAANLIVLSQYTEALKYLDEAVGLISRFNSIRVNSAYILNNYCVAAVLAEKMIVKDASNILESVIASSTFGDWMYILQLNYCLFIAQSGALSNAEEQLNALLQIVKELSDDYYIFYVAANLASVHFLQGHRAEAIQLLKQYCQEAPTLFKETEKAYLQERTAQWIQLFATADFHNCDELETILLNLHPGETQWNFVGRVFLYSDIQFWSEP